MVLGLSQNPQILEGGKQKSHQPSQTPTTDSSQLCTGPAENSSQQMETL